MKLILASASPRRAELLRQIGVDFDVRAVDIDESPQVAESPKDYVERLAVEKARTAKLLYQQQDVLVLGSDTAVIIDDEILGKPEDKQHALDMLQRLSAQTHTVLTSVALVGERECCIVNENLVTFSRISNAQLEWYLATGEAMDKAGSYAIQGHAAIFIKHLEGSFSGVMGLPLYETYLLLKQQGFSVP